MNTTLRARCVLLADSLFSLGLCATNSVTPGSTVIGHRHCNMWSSACVRLYVSVCLDVNVGYICCNPFVNMTHLNSI